MSAIFGFCMADTNEYQTEDLIKLMLPWNRPYGPEGEATFCCDNYSLGCCVEQLSDRNIQTNPILHYGAVHAVLDAVIYNRDELIEKCRAAFEISDAELLFKYIFMHGTSALKDVNGDFCGAIYDETTRKLTLFRDHMGVRPLYFYQDDVCVAFSTDLRGLAALPIVHTKISEEWIFKTVAGYDTDIIDNTPYERIACVYPASATEFSFAGNSVSIETGQYWKLGKRKIRRSSDEEYISELRNLITDSVARRLAAVSGTVGAEMSGGLDSSVIDILINRAGRDCVYYSWSKDPSEVELAEQDERIVVADICKSENIVCNYAHIGDNYEPGMADVVRKAGIAVPDEGSGDFRFALLPNVNTYQMVNASQFVHSKGARVVFSGHGGDEGASHRCNVYELYLAHEYYHYWRYLWSVTRKGNRFFGTLMKGFRNIRDSRRSLKETYLNWYESPELLSVSFAKKQKVPRKEALQFEFDPIAYVYSGGSRNRLDNMALFGAYSGVRYLVPLLDYRVIDFAVSIPRYMFANKGSKRYIYRQAFKDIIPPSLYRLNIKEDTSIRNIPAKENWQEDYISRKREIIGSLNREYWSRYLDFDKIDAHLTVDIPRSDEEQETELRHLKALLKCALAQNLLDKAKETHR